MSLLSARGVAKAYGPQVLFDDVALTVEAGDRIGVLGINGTGKSTFLRVLAGLEPADHGTVDRQRGANILYLAQEPNLDPAKSASEVVLEGLAAWSAAATRHAAVTRAIEGGDATPERLAEQSHLAEDVERLGGWERGHVAEGILGKLGIVDQHQLTGTMSGGERRRVALAQILVAAPELAILDEPTNHLDAETIEWLEGYLVDEFRGAVLMVTHDRYVLDAVATRIVELSRGKLQEFVGNYGTYLEKKEELELHEARVEQNRLNFVRRETAWLRRGAKARTTKQKARIQRAEAAIATEGPKAYERVRLEGTDVARTGKTILELSDLALEVGGKRLFSGLTFTMVPGERVGILGKNGSGKTSLLRALTGDLAPAAGKITVGKNTKIVLFDQARANLVDDWSIYDNVAERLGAEATGGGVVEIGDMTINLKTYLEQFLFEPSKQRQRVGAPSGGERARVALAKTLKSGANLLLLDEPTNDLDIATLGALEDMMCERGGCAIVVSHDRAFLNRVATSILAFEPGKVTAYPGNYDTYLSLKPEPASEIPPTKPSASPPPKEAAPAASQPPAGKKLTYAERIELEGLMDRITAAEERAKELERQLADPTLYATRPEAAGKLHAAMAASQAEAHALTARWEELEARSGLR
jgi:ABC transport system ATP-binding/permease protein